jgi:protein TonB
VIARPAPAPPIAGKGDEVNAGASDAGAGTGGGGQGSGTGSGAGGAGQGGGAVSKLEKIAGNIDSARDYPAAGRALRRGDSVTITVSVDSHGRPQGCRIVRPSKDPDADRITCRLAIQRFRFRPRTDAAGNPAPGLYQWTQRWWAPREEKD